jgi:hypothetical protein
MKNNCCSNCNTDNNSSKSHYDTCPCHKQTEKVEWAKELRLLPQLYKASKGDIIAIKSFISNLILQEKAKWKEEITERFDAKSDKADQYVDNIKVIDKERLLES